MAFHGSPAGGASPALSIVIDSHERGLSLDEMLGLLDRTPMWIRCPQCDVPFEIKGKDPQAEVRCPSCDGSFGRLRDAGTDVEDPLEARKLHGFSGHTRAVCAIAFSPDGRTLASGSSDSALMLWDVTSRRKLGRLDVSPGDARCLAFSPDGGTLASGGSDEVIRLWDTATGSERVRLSGHGQVLHALAFSPDGQYLASGSANPGGARLDWGKLIVWEIASGRTLEGPRINECNCRALAFSPDGRTLAAMRDNHLLVFMDIETGAAVPAAEKHDMGQNSIAFTPDGKTVISASLDGKLRCWDPSSGALKGVLVTRQRDQGFMPFGALSASVSPDGRLVAVGMLSGPTYDVQIFELGSGRARALLKNRCRGVSAVAFSADGRLLAAGGESESGAGVTLLWLVSA